MTLEKRMLVSGMPLLEVAPVPVTPESYAVMRKRMDEILQAVRAGLYVAPNMLGGVPRRKVLTAEQETCTLYVGEPIHTTRGDVQ
jgi:hypothetical protein